MNKEVKISFEEQDVILKPSEFENDVVVMRSQEIDGTTHFDLYLTKQEALQLSKELIKYFE